MTLFGIDEIVHQFDVEKLPLQFDSVVSQYIALPFQVVSDFIYFRVLENSPEIFSFTCGCCPFPVAVCTYGNPFYAREDVGAKPFGNDGRLACILCNPADFGRGYFMIFKFFRFAVGSLCRLSEILLQGAEFISVENLCRLAAESCIKTHRRGVDVHRHIGADCHKVMAHGDMPSGFLECRLLFRSQLVKMAVYFPGGPVFSYEFLCPHFSHTFHSRDIVRGVSADSQDFNDLFRVADAVFSADLFFSEDFPFTSGLARLVLDYMVGHELSVILVRSHHIHCEPFGCSLACDSPDHIVRFIPHDHEHRDVQRLANLREGFECVYHQLRGCFPCRLVVGIYAVAECPSGRVERHCQMGGPFLFDKFQDIFREPEQDGSVFSFGIDHRMPEKGIVHLENEGVSVYKKKSLVHLRKRLKHQR